MFELKRLQFLTLAFVLCAQMGVVCNTAQAQNISGLTLLGTEDDTISQADIEILYKYVNSISNTRYKQEMLSLANKQKALAQQKRSEGQVAEAKDLETTANELTQVATTQTRIQFLNSLRYFLPQNFRN